MEDHGKCPECNAALKVKVGKYGPFLGCTRWPECKGSRPLPGGETRTDRTPKPEGFRLRIVWPDVVYKPLRERKHQPYLRVFR